VGSFNGMALDRYNVVGTTVPEGVSAVQDKPAVCDDGWVVER